MQQEIDWGEVTKDDLVLILERAARPMHEDEIYAAWQQLMIERTLEELVAEGFLERVGGNGEVGYRMSRARRMEKAVELRRQGLTFKDIGKRLGLDPATVSMYMFEARRWDLCHPTPRQLAAWREAASG